MRTNSVKKSSQSPFAILLNPRTLLLGGIEYYAAWLFSRRWLRWIFFLSPAWIIVLSAVGLVGTGALTSKPLLTQRYTAWIEKEIPEVDLRETPNQPLPPQNSGPASSDGLTNLGEISQYGDLLLRRLLILRNSNAPITYVVATRLHRSGRVGQAVQMLRRIAPAKGGGFPPAHSWLAAERLSQGPLESDADNSQLITDLESARVWNHVPPSLIAVHAQLLENQKHIGAALAAMEEATEKDGRFAVVLANMAARNGREQRSDRFAARAKHDIRLRMENQEETVEDLVSLADIFLLEGDPQRALEVINMGLKKAPDNIGLHHLLSTAYLHQYIKTVKFSSKSMKVNLGLLDAALKANPANPNVGIQIARLVSNGQTTTPGQKKALQKQLADGTATSVTHILLADSHFKNGQLTQAIPHLQLANRQSPGTPLIQNNLAMAIAKTDPTRLPEALTLVNAAVQGDPKNADYRDSQGELRQMNGDLLGAVEAYETAIGLNKTRPDIRAHIAAAYRKLGMPEMAQTHEDALKPATPETVENETEEDE